MIQWRQDARRVVEYIAGLDDDGRDRVLTAQAWTLGSFVDLDGSRCLAGHGENLRFNAKGFICSDSSSGWLNLGQRHVDVGHAFDRVARHTSPDRVVAFCKRRAARPNRLPLCQPLSPVEKEVGVAQ